MENVEKCREIVEDSGLGFWVCKAQKASRARREKKNVLDKNADIFVNRPTRFGMILVKLVCCVF